MKFLVEKFNILAILEGISYLMLFGITMPLKYLADMPLPNKYLGMAHGVLFILYILMIIPVSMHYKWNLKTIAIAVVASILPFGTFYVEKNYLKEA